MRVRTADDPPLLKPFLADWTEETLETQKVVRIEDIVNDSFEVVGVVGIHNLVFRVGRLNGELMRDVCLPATVDGTDAGRKAFIVEVLDVGVHDGDFPLLKELDHT